MDSHVFRILLIDDDREDHLLTGVLLLDAVQNTYVLEWAPSYEEGAQKLLANEYDAVLVDYDLSDTRTGIDLIKEFVSKGYPAPLILYTTRLDHQIDQAAFEAGATLYLGKREATTFLLERTIRYAIAHRAVQANLQQQTSERLQAESRLQQERELLRLIIREKHMDRQMLTDMLESISDGYFALDQDWRFTYVNRRASTNIGVPRTDLTGQSIWNRFPRLLGTPLENAIRQVMHHRRSSHLDAPGIASDRTHRFNIYPITNGVAVYWLDLNQSLTL